MKISKRQLKRIVRKTLLEAVPDPKWKSRGPGDPGQWSEPPEEQDDYDYGYQDGGDGVPPMDNPSDAYSDGYEDGKYDADVFQGLRESEVADAVADAKANHSGGSAKC